MAEENKNQKFRSKNVNEIKISHPATRLRGDVVTMSLCTSQWRHRYVSNEIPNDVSVKRRQDFSVVRLHDVWLVCRDDVSWGRNNDVPSVRFQDVLNKSQMKHPMTSQWYVFTTSYCYAVMTSHGDDVPSVRLHDVSDKSQMKRPMTSQWYVTKTSQWYISTTSH